VFGEVRKLVPNVGSVCEHTVQLFLNDGQLLVFEPDDLSFDGLEEVERFNQLLVHVSRRDRLLQLGVLVRDLLLLVDLLTHSHRQVAHLGQGLEVGEELKVLGDVLLG